MEITEQVAQMIVAGAAAGGVVLAVCIFAVGFARMLFNVLDALED